MKVTILNGATQNQVFNSYLSHVNDLLEEKCDVKMFNIDEMDLHFCRGCWDCWWRTPGECSTQDGAEVIFDSVINSDFVLFASPLVAGFTSSALKKVVDRLIVLLHPYVVLKNGECHHKKRYDKYPQFGLLLQKEADTDDEDIEIINNIYDRFSLNFHNERKYTYFIDERSAMEVVDVTCNI